MEMDPVRALEGSYTTFQAAAYSAVFDRVVKWLSPEGEGEPVPVEKIQEEACRYALNGARYPSFSTSPTTNLMKLYTTSAWAQVLEILRYG